MASSSAPEVVLDSGLELAHPAQNSPATYTDKKDLEYEVQGLQESKRRICGLSPNIFWLLILAMVIIVAAAIGGGVGGGLAAQNKNKR